MLTHIVEAMADYQVILEPDRDAPEWWAGAPSVARGEDGTFYLACRMREGDSQRGLRGYEVRILKSSDGCDYQPIHHIRRDDAGVPGFERPAIVRDPATGKFRLYGCAPLEGGWGIIRWDDADDPADFRPETARPVLQPNYPNDGFVHVKGYKDPFIMWHAGRWHMFVIGCDAVERTWHFTSDDGDDWQLECATPILENTGWHSFFTRPACVLPMAVGHLFVYEGSHVGWHDPPYNIATGLAYSPDLKTFIDLTPAEPLLRSTTPGDYHTWRYSHWMTVEDKVYAYFEAARPNNTNEIRLGIFESTCAEMAHGRC